MFYPVDSLKRGGRFYLCWVADSWPLRFAAITHRQLWSQDIRQLCDDLLEVMTNESGRPTHRFSLRLSSQLLRGLVRLYERKVTVLLCELCMINAQVFKSTNKKLVVQNVHVRPLRRLPQLPAAGAVLEEPEEQRVEELIQNSGNAVANIQDITLKEAVIPELQLPPNDNFGEENPYQPLQTLLADRTIEMMMQETSGAQISGLDLPVDKSTDKSHDKSRSALEVPQMESIAELDVTLFRKSTTEDILPAFEKDVPEIPDVTVPELPAPTDPIPIPEIQVEQQLPEEIAPQPELPKETEEPVQELPKETEEPGPELPKEIEEPARETRAKAAKRVPSVDIELEELEEQPLGRKRRRGPPKLIVDKRIKLGSDFLRARLDNPCVEMRCEDFSDAIIDVRTTAEVLLREPAAVGGSRRRSRISPLLGVLYQRNLAVTRRGLPLADRLLEQETEEPRQRRTRSTALENIAEVEEPQQQIEPPLAPPASDITKRTTEGPEDAMNVTAPNITAEVLNVPEDAMNITAEANITTGALNVTMDPLNVPNAEQPGPHEMQVDIADLPTQKLETLSQISRKRTSEHVSSAKRQRSMGYVSFRESKQQKSIQPPEIVFDEPDKENIPPNIQEQPEPIAEQPSAMPQQPSAPLEQPAVLEKSTEVPLEQSQADAARLLQEAGLSDLQQYPVEAHVTQESRRESRARVRGSEGSETPLGSLDRTKVSLGDSVTTTDSQRFIRNQWGIEGTMMKIMVAVRHGGAVTIDRLLHKGPLLPGHKSIIAARCFTSILKLKQHGFVRIVKDPDTLEIRNMSLGPRFDSL